MDILKTGNILVPFDFSEVSENALANANKFAKIFNKKISLLYVTEKQGAFNSGVDKKEKESTKKLTKVAEANVEKHGIATEAIIRQGNIFDQIGDTADVIKSTLIVMGTHGIKGMQALTGSRAMKVITNAKTPFVVVQKKAWNPDGMKKIMLPINDDPETKQKVEWAGFFAQIFKSTVYVFSQNKTDEFVNNKINNNVAWTKNKLKKEGVAIEHIEIGKKEDYTKTTLSKAIELGIDLIIVETDPETNITEYVMGPFEQKIIANDAQIPVMCINTKQVYSVSGNIFSYI
jgi:nucleotide-binding universal stress UspA family protein